MRQFRSWPAQATVFALLVWACSSWLTRAADPPVPEHAALAATLLQRAQAEVDRIRPLVEDGTLPKTRLIEAEDKLADAQDEGTLAETLYSQARVQDMTDAQVQAMIAAAQRRVDRQTKLVLDREKLLAAGVLARSEVEGFRIELQDRQRVLQLAEQRAKLLDNLKEMAAVEERVAEAGRSVSPALRDVMLRYDGNGSFNAADLTTVSAEFQRRFHRALPISAMGQTALHQAMGLDHRGRVDVAINPDSSEGVWLRHLLERLRISYLAFRSAISGAATGPHIHIGTGSTRLIFARR
jgi:hypothetical protein